MIDMKRFGCYARASHLGMGHDPMVMWVADRLDSAGRTWAPFSRLGTRWLYYHPSMTCPEVACRSGAAIGASVALVVVSRFRGIRTSRSKSMRVRRHDRWTASEAGI